MRGHNGTAGEIGHMCIHINGRECSCGNRGCLEAYVGGWAIQKAAEGTAPQEVFLKASRGIKKYREILDTFFEYLMTGTSSLLNLYNPKRVI